MNRRTAGARVATLLAAVVLPLAAAAPGAASGEQTMTPLDDVARGYVMAVLRLDRIRPGTNDHDYCPAAWSEEVAGGAEPSVTTLRPEVQRLLQLLEGNAPPADQLSRERHRWLASQLRAMDLDLQILGGKKLPVKEQVAGLFGLQARYTPEAELAETRRRLDAALPGAGDLAARLETFRSSFRVPADKVEPMYRFVLEEVRRRALAFVDLPASEVVTLGFVTGKSWGGYNYYKGEHRSHIDINLDLPVQADRVFPYAAHEAYPGHHTELVAREEYLYRQRGWVEWCVSPLFTPKNALSEAIAEVGKDLLFTPEERYLWLRDVLWPRFELGGNLEIWRKVEPLLERLEDARDNLPFLLHDQGKSDAEAVSYLERHQMVSREQALKRVQFDREWGVYAFNYRTGRQLLERYVNQGGAGLAERRRRFLRLITRPVTPALVQEWIDSGA